MKFASDNWSGVLPEVSNALQRHAEGFATAYGDSTLDRSIEQKFAKLFERDCDVFFVGTGTAANSMAAAAASRPGGVVFAQSEAHVIANEGGAPESFTNGGRLVPVAGEDGLMDPDALKAAIKRYPNTFNHLGQGTMVTITQSTEAGTVYGIEHIQRICEVARAADLPVHMDGARFANALVKLGCSPAEMTWKCGIDMVSFGATKNGCWSAEALLIFNDKLLHDFKFLRKRMGHLFSKTRFISAQFEGYFENDAWLSAARHSNGIGAALEEMVSRSNRVRLAWKSGTNQVFFIAEQAHAEKMLEQGAAFYPFPAPKRIAETMSESEQLYRLVASFSSTLHDVEALGNLVETC